MVYLLKVGILVILISSNSLPEIYKMIGL